MLAPSWSRQERNMAHSEGFLDKVYERIVYRDLDEAARLAEIGSFCPVASGEEAA